MNKKNLKPNWKSKQDYHFINKMKGREVAWEFLRRNPEYIEDYNTFNFLENEIKRKKRSFLFRGKPSRSKDQLIANKYHLVTLYDPLKGYEQGVKFLKYSEFPKILTFQEEFEDFLDEEPSYDPSTDEEVDIAIKVRDGVCVVAFDRHQSLGPQLKEFKKQETKLRKSNSVKITKDKAYLSLHIKYLRVLDALALGVESPQIADIIGYSPIQKTKSKGSQAGDYINSAKEMSKQGYLTLLKNDHN